MTTMDRTLYLLGGLGVGAGLMFLLDPDRGNRRRALVRDKFSHWSRTMPETFKNRGEDLRNRLYGFFVEARSRLRPEQVDDQTLMARVRSSLGRAASRPGDIFVTVDQGEVTLAGSAPEREVPEIMEAVATVRGVKGVRNELVQGRPYGEDTVDEGSRKRGRRVA